MRTTILFLLLSPFMAVKAAPSSELWVVWTPHNAVSNDSVNHTAWAALLERHVSTPDDGIARFDYARVSDQEHKSLKQYLNNLAGVAVTDLNRTEQKAYWINLYNALTVDVILDHYPVDSIRDIKLSGLFSIGPWKADLITVEGHALSLNDIEHRILRPIWDDPRIHYAVNCASLGCPNLQNRAFTADNTESLLNTAAHEFINHQRAVHIVDDELIVSSIFDWFIEDFGDNEEGVIKHIMQFADDDLKQTLSRFDSFDDEYDWQLNDTQAQ